MGDTVLATTARGLLRLSPRPRLLPTPTCCTADTGSDTGATEATTVTVSATTDTVSATTARGLLRLSPRPRPTPTCCTADTDTDTVSDTIRIRTRSRIRRLLLGIDCPRLSVP